MLKKIKTRISDLRKKVVTSKFAQNKIVKFLYWCIEPVVKIIAWFGKIIGKILKWFGKHIRVIVLLVIIYWCYSSWQAKNVSQQAQSGQEAAAVVREDLRKDMIRSGKIELQGVVQVAPPISGVINTLEVQNGQMVQAGDTLFTIKSDATPAQQASAYASYLSAKNAYEEAKNSIGHNEWISFNQAMTNVLNAEERVKEFEKEHTDRVKIEDLEYQNLLREQENARRQVTMATIEPAMAQQRLEAATASYRAAESGYHASLDGNYRSPIDGRIENLGVNVGEKVIAEVGDKDGTPLFLLIPAGKKTISMQVSGRDVNQLEVGQQAIVKDKLIPDAEFSASIVRISKVGAKAGEQGESLTFQVWLEINEDDERLLLGNTVEITLILQQAVGALVVPSTSVNNGQVIITNEQLEVVEMRPVETGLEAGGKTEIITGVSEGELILIGAPELMMPTSGDSQSAPAVNVVVTPAQ